MPSVTKLNPNGTSLVYSTFLGGSGIANPPPPIPGSRDQIYNGDSAYAIAIDTFGNAYVAGQTDSGDFPVTSGAFQTVNRGYANQRTNGFISKLDSTGASLVYSTFLGGSGQPYVGYGRYPQDAVNAIFVDAAGNAYVAGFTNSTDFPITAAALISASDGAGTGFVSKLNAAGSELEYSTFLGGDFAWASGVAVDQAGKAYVTGNADGANFAATPDALIPAPPPKLISDSPFVAKLNTSGTGLEFASFIGGTSGGDSANVLTLGPSGNVYVTGATGSTVFPVSAGAYQQVNNAASTSTTNAFVAAFNLSNETTDCFPVTTSVSASAMLSNQGQAVTLTAKVMGLSSEPVPTGQATIMGVTVPNPEVTLDQTGTATWTSSAIPPGFYEAYITYAGDSIHLASTSPYQLAKFRVVGPPTLIKNPGDNYYYTYGEFSNLPLSAEVTDSTGYPLQGVTVNFSGSAFAFAPASAVTNANGIATVNFTALKAGAPLVATASVSGIATALSIPVTITPSAL